MTPGRQLREAIDDGLVQAMASHSPLSARLAEEAGFGALWASGFELSALYGLPDVSVVSMAEHLEMTRRIVEAVSVPVIADIDTGFGNAINVMHAVRSYERAGVAAVVIEDKTFPKVTSLVEGGRQELLAADQFQGKIEAACSARVTPDLLVIARTEALIAGHGEAEALDRAYAYVDAGADLVLVHSKSSEPTEFVSFARRWQASTPLAIVPTSYPALTPARARALGNVGLYIYGNHAIRASTAAMQQVFSTIVDDDDMIRVENQIAPVAELFRLQGMDEIKANEQRFLR